MADILNPAAAIALVLGSVRLAGPFILKAIELVKSTSGNGTGRSYVEIKDTIILGAQMEQLVKNTAPLANLAQLMDLMHAEIAEVRSDVQEGRDATAREFEAVHNELDALASGVMGLREPLKERVG
jgi:hypothetical protein